VKVDRVEHIKRHRDAGLTLQAIGNEFGVTRERIRQILVKQYGSTESAAFAPGTHLTTSDLKTMVPKHVIWALQHKGIITPLSYGRWPLDTLDKINQNAKRCKLCSELILEKHRLAYCCNACAQKSKKHYYLRWTEEQKERHKANVTRWKRNHPERQREIDRKAGRTYYRRHHGLKYLKFTSIILIQEETMEEYPYEAKIVTKQQVIAALRQKATRGTYSMLLQSLKLKLLPGQAIVLTVDSKKERSSIEAAWRNRNKEQDARAYSIKSEGKYLVYLWLGELRERKDEVDKANTP
jgi:hypothetical protein